MRKLKASTANVLKDSNMSAGDIRSKEKERKFIIRVKAITEQTVNAIQMGFVREIHGRYLLLKSPFMDYTQSIAQKRTFVNKAKQRRKDKIFVQIGKALKEWRTNKGLTQKEAAETIGEVQTRWARWERGEVEPGSGKIKKIAEAFGADANELLGIEKK